MAKFRVGDTVYLRQGLERNEPRAFTVTENLSENGIDYVRVDHPTCPEGAWEEKFFELTPSPDAGRSPAIVPVNPKPPAVDSGPNERFYLSIDELLTAALAAWVARDDRTAVDAVTRAIEIVRQHRESAGGRRQ